jgi:hypothetical protein
MKREIETIKMGSKRMRFWENKERERLVRREDEEQKKSKSVKKREREKERPERVLVA